MVNNLLKNFHCTEVEGVSYLHTDLAVECYAGEHTVASTMAAVLLILYIIIVPVIVYRITTRPAETMRDPRHIAMYGFIFSGYSTGSEWWELLARQNQ